MSKTKVTVGITYPHFWRDRVVNAEVASRRKIGRGRGRWLWRVRLTESQQPVRTAEGGVSVEFDLTTKELNREVSRAASFRRFAPSRDRSCVAQWIETPGGYLWCEIRDDVVCGSSRPTHWQTCEYGSVEALLASGDAVRVN